MAKRTRGSVRPGQRQPLRRTARPTGSPATPSPAAAPDPGLTAADEARAAELEARIVAEERAAAAASTRNRERARAESPSPRPNRRGGTMAVRYADEYAYVSRDLRRIGIVSALLLGILAVLFIAVQVLGIGI
jgi:hypothetical protein